MSKTEILFCVLGLALFGGAVWANVWNTRRRSTMSAAEREADDAEAQREANIW